MLAVTFYDAITAVHVMSIVVAFGVIFAYPLMGPVFARSGSLAVYHEVQGRLGKFLITPAMTLALASGIYLASDRDYFSETWVQVPMGILIFLFALGGAFFGPNEEKAAAAARTDPQGAEYQAIVRRLTLGVRLAQVLVLVAIYFMVAKPGA